MQDFQSYIMPILWLLAGILGLWKQLSDLRNGDKTVDGSVAGEISQAWERLNEPLLKRIDELQKKMETMEKREAQHLRLIGELVRGAKIHFEQLENAKIQSAWIIPDDLRPLFEQIANAQVIESVTTPNSKHSNRSGLSRK